MDDDKPKRSVSEKSSDRASEKPGERAKSALASSADKNEEGGKTAPKTRKYRVQEGRSFFIADRVKVKGGAMVELDDKMAKKLTKAGVIEPYFPDDDDD